MQLGVCLPESCTQAAMINFLKPAFQYLDLELNEIDYCTTSEPRGFSFLQISTIFLIGSIFLLCILGTLQVELLLFKNNGKQIYLYQVDL